MKEKSEYRDPEEGGEGGEGKGVGGARHQSRPEGPGITYCTSTQQGLLTMNSIDRIILSNAICCAGMHNYETR